LARTVRNVNLIELIKACGEAGVYRLKQGELEIEFGHVWPHIRKENSDNVAFSAELGDNGDEVSEQDESFVKEMKAAELLIEDPELYERMQIGEGE
jgi:hypothetical protein